jgi:hypothetical protein
MAELAQALAQINDRELDANEAALSQCFPSPPELSPDEPPQQAAEPEPSNVIYLADYKKRFED